MSSQGAALISITVNMHVSIGIAFGIVCISHEYGRPGYEKVSGPVGTRRCDVFQRENVGQSALKYVATFIVYERMVP